jgi:hypothetical protein
MLTLKGIAKSNQIELSYAPKQSRFTSDFYKGLLIAVAFHVILLVVFKVKMTLDPKQKPFLPFTQVMAEVGKGVTASILSQQSSLSPWDNEQMPQMPTFTSNYEIQTAPIATIQLFETLTIDFSSLEKFSYRELLQEGIDD